MADNYLEDKFEELRKKKEEASKVSKVKKVKPTHVKPKFYQDDIREEIDDDRQ